MELGKWISKRDSLAMLEIAHASLSCETDDHYRRLIGQLKHLLFFDCFICGFADKRRISYDSLVSDSFNTGYPPGYYESYLKRNYHLIDPLFQRFYKTFEVQNSRELKALYKTGPERAVSRLREDFGVNNIFIYGLRDPDLNSFSILSVAGQQIKNDRRTATIIKYMTLYLTIAIKSLVSFRPKRDITILTPSELDILNWLKRGKSSWEISVILNKSERVVIFHINNMLKKLSAANRTHAVAIALEKQLIAVY